MLFFTQIFNFLHFFRNPPRATEVCVTNEEKASIEDELKLCKQSLNDCSKLSNDSKNGPSSKPSSKQKGPEQHECLQNKVYMKRFINILLRVSKLNEDMPQNLDIHLHITVTPKQLEILQKFSKGSNDVSLPQLDHVLSSALMSSSSNIFLEEYIPWSVVTDYIQSREVSNLLKYSNAFLRILHLIHGHFNLACMWFVMWLLKSDQLGLLVFVETF